MIFFENAGEIIGLLRDFQTQDDRYLKRYLSGKENAKNILKSAFSGTLHRSADTRFWGC
jgi:hypothetical protein